MIPSINRAMVNNVVKQRNLFTTGGCNPNRWEKALPLQGW